MKSQEAIKIGIDMAEFVGMAYLADLTDAELMMRPHPECNHLNWQIGHLIVSEHHMLNSQIPGGMPALPAGFSEKYCKETAKIDDPAQFADKATLFAAFKEQRAATLNALAAASEADLDKQTGVDYAPTLGAMFGMQGGHWLMHCGQWVILRRQLGKPVLI